MNKFTPRRIHINQGPVAPRPWLCRIYLAARSARLLATMVAIGSLFALIGTAIFLSDAIAQPEWQLVFYGFAAACGVMACCDIALGDIDFWLNMESIRVVNRLIDEAEILIDERQVRGSSLKFMGGITVNQRTTILCASEYGDWIVIQANQNLGTEIPGIKKYAKISHEDAVTMLGKWGEIAAQKCV